MRDQQLIAALRRAMVETGSLLCLGCGYEHSCAVHGCAIIRRAAERLEELTAPPNAPLTLEQLREMKGEPVWISPVADGGKISERWMLMSDFFPESRTYIFMPAGGMAQGYKASTYGKTWTAYRRKPEEGAT